jgi:hypothetical protein
MNVVDRGQRVHERKHVRRAELVLDEIDEWLLHGEVVAPFDVVIVEQNHEQPHVRPCGFTLLVVRGSNRTGWSGLRGFGGIHLHDGERIDLLGLAVLSEGKLLLGHVHHRLAVLVGHDRIYPDVVDAGPDRRRLRLLRRLRLRLWRGRRRRVLRSALRARLHRHGQCHRREETAEELHKH